MSKAPKTVEPMTGELPLPDQPADQATMVKALDFPSINEPPAPMETPVITGLAPDTAVIGADAEDFTLVVSGEGFVNGISIIHFAGHDEPTTWNADGTLSTGVKPSLWAEPVDVPVGVRNGPLMSAFSTFSFTAAPEADATTTNRRGTRRRGY